MTFKLTPAQAQGLNAERFAAKFLQANGLKVKSTNFRCKVGEIDIIALDQNSLVFVEVRHRQNNRYGTPAETVTFKKQQRLIRTSQYYMQRHNLDLSCRFDVIESIKLADTYHVNWIKNAFDAY